MVIFEFPHLKMHKSINFSGQPVYNSVILALFRECPIATYEAKMRAAGQCLYAYKYHK